MLYVMPVPVGAVTVMVPVATAQVGCRVALAVGGGGVIGCVLMTISADEADIHPAALVTV